VENARRDERGSIGTGFRGVKKSGLFWGLPRSLAAAGYVTADDEVVAVATSVTRTGWTPAGQRTDSQHQALSSALERNL